MVERVGDDFRFFIHLLLVAEQSHDLVFRGEILQFLHVLCLVQHDHSVLLLFLLDSQVKPPVQAGFFRNIVSEHCDLVVDLDHVVIARLFAWV